MHSTILLIPSVTKLTLFGIKIFFNKLGEGDKKGRFLFTLLKKTIIKD